MTIIDNWRAAWRMASMQIAAAAVVFGSLPAETQQSILTALGIPDARVPAILGALVIVGRLISQPKARGK